jgi:hypothetical protein
VGEEAIMKQRWVLGVVILGWAAASCSAEPHGSGNEVKTSALSRTTHEKLVAGPQLLSRTAVMEAAFGLTHLTGKAAERTARSRDDTRTAGWRLDVSCDQGNGSIVLWDDAPPLSRLQGEGIFRGWSQAKLLRVYDSLLESATSGDQDFRVPQLG